MSQSITFSSDVLRRSEPMVEGDNQLWQKATIDNPRRFIQWKRLKPDESVDLGRHEKVGRLFREEMAAKLDGCDQALPIHVSVRYSINN